MTSYIRSLLMVSFSSDIFYKSWERFSCDIISAAADVVVIVIVGSGKNDNGNSISLKTVHTVWQREQNTFS